MFCASCGNALEARAGFCPRCGATLAAQSPQPVSGVPRAVMVMVAAVVALVFLVAFGIAAAIVIPQFVRARARAAEFSARRDIQEIQRAQRRFRSQRGRYAESLDELGSMLPERLAAGVSGQYRFRITGDGVSYSIQANPAGGSGPPLYSDQTLVIRPGITLHSPPPVSPVQ